MKVGLVEVGLFSAGSVSSDTVEVGLFSAASDSSDKVEVGLFSEGFSCLAVTRRPL